MTSRWWCSTVSEPLTNPAYPHVSIGQSLSAAIIHISGSRMSIVWLQVGAGTLQTQVFELQSGGTKNSENTPTSPDCVAHGAITSSCGLSDVETSIPRRVSFVRLMIQGLESHQPRHEQLNSALSRYITCFRTHRQAWFNACGPAL